jgi:ElaB/YqjD/DUF883 family membrane-anchored ribosome-binding protein
MTTSDEDENRHGSRSAFADRLPSTEDLCGEVESYIRAKPFRAVLIALLAGILVGKIIL